ncbi:MAG: hypothetical protein H6659_15615 [Ardenticatenaceae bacterium]|nr:hypothetical protein [Ardenticatenaceae bacterium]MCB8988013.1 hypothetical protein [Ardenticatenaceae bacterium]
MTQSSDTSPRPCPECGAPPVAGLNCGEQLGAVLAWEWQDPELSAQHFLTVASYNLQHPAQFTAAAYAGLRAAFIDHLDNGLPVAEIRRRISHVAEGSQRVLQPEAERRFVLRPWPQTIADVYLPDQPEGAAGRVRAWAASIRAEFATESNP